ncbi:DUF551 domain-containing protein [Enterobacter roggenkampii]|uniref:DUF551 domain-containing protein n=1 Tax=Enterobacter roggenkampii TaxID=1812935 RepID=UPI002FD846B1
MTTNNHPANGPVSLERLHQIRETLSKAAAQSDGGNIGYAMADAVKVIDGAIAAFGTEPVAYMTYKGYLLHAADPKLAEYSDPTPLYTAPPAPVSVPDAMEMDDDFDSAFEHGKAVGWNACRAAMLQGAEPAQEWIPCSERMPEQFKAILVFNEYGEVWSGAYDRYWNFYCDNELVECVTHWMPLPAAPQQEVK